MECFRCGTSEEKTYLFDAISTKGIVKICRKCSFKEDIPIIKSQKSQEKLLERKQTVYERLSKISGVKGQKDTFAESKINKEQEAYLKDIANKNFEKHIPEKKSRPDLIDNFHWVIMRVRRLKKITQEQLAKEITEPERAIKLAEQGIVPDGYKLIRKIENYLGIKLIKEEYREGIFEVSKTDQSYAFPKNKISEQSEISFDEETTKTLTIADLQEMKQKRGRESLEDPFKSQIDEEDIFENPKKDKKKSQKYISQKEIDDLLFGRGRDEE